MSQILNKVRDVNPNDSDAVKEALTGFFHNLSKQKDDCNRWLRALENVINRFPKYCGQHRATIENYLCHFLDTNNYYNVIEAAKCAHAVQQVRPQQEKTASAKTCWRDQMAALCDAAHILIDAVYTRSAHIYNKDRKTKKVSQLTTSPLQAALVDIAVVTSPQDIANKGEVLCNRLRNVLVFIQAMLVEIYPVAKPIRPQLILEVILQGLSASGNEDSPKVATVKVQALRTLDAMVACLASNLIPFSGLVFRVVMQTLRWSSDHPSEHSRKVRCTAYNSLTRWLTILRVHRESDNRARSWDTELTSHIADDVIPPKHVVQLTANAQPMKNLSKKARKKLANSMLMQSNISSHGPGERNKIHMSEESNEEVSIAALECAEAYLTSCGMFIKPTTHKQFQEILVRECYNIVNYSPERSISLLRALEACRKSCSPKVPPPTQYCLHLYSTLVNYHESEISKFSSQALLDIRLHLHCSPPSLHFTVEQQTDKKQEDKRKRVSERNRAVLESLLGKERLPSEDLAEEDEIISIPDEPTTKRLRLDEDAEKISLSSESESVVITDDSVEELDAQDDSNETDYIIEPIDEKERAFEDLQMAQSSQSYIAPDDNLEGSDEMDGVQNIEAVDDERINLTQNDVQEYQNYKQGVCNDEEEVRVDVQEAKNDGQEIQNHEQEIDNSAQEAVQEINSSQNVNNIYEAKTQMPLHVSHDTNGTEKSPPLSMEVTYDYPNTGQEKVSVLEKMDEDNLPSTNDTDDVHITCGQDVKSSQEVEETKETEMNGLPKENGVEKTPEHIVENGVAVLPSSSPVPNGVQKNTIEKEITVDDMFADFVDEVNDESQTQVG